MSDTRNLAKKHKEETLMAESCKRIKESTMLTTVPLLPSTLTILQAMAIPPSPLPPKFGERILAHTSAFSGVAKLPSSYVLYACHVMDDGIGDAQHLIDFAKYHESIPAFSLYKPLIMIRFGKVNQANIENMLRDQGYKIHSDNIHLICIDNIMLETPTKLTSMAVRIIEGFWLNEHDYKCLLQCAQFFHCCSGDNSFEHAISCGAIPIYQIKLLVIP